MVPRLNKEDPCYKGIQRIGAILNNAASDGRIHRLDLRLDVFFEPSGPIAGYRVNLQTASGWRSATFFKEDLIRASDESTFRERLAPQIEALLSVGA
jgi:hypothetical protein